jgi:hypothetical protein
VSPGRSACADHHDHPKAVAEAFDRLVTEIGLGPGGYLGPVDVGGIQGGHKCGMYDALVTTRGAIPRAQEMTPNEVQEPSPVSETTRRRTNLYT